MMHTIKTRISWLLTPRHLFMATLLLVLFVSGRATMQHVRTLVVWGDLLEQVSAVDDPEPAPIITEHPWEFLYTDATRTITARVDPAELERARAIDTSRVFGTRLWLRAGYVSDLVRDQAGSRFIDALATEFRSLRDELDLDGDEYVELMACAIQAIPYGEPKSDMLLPIEVVADANGVCSEKSILLAALLLHEEYDTCVWVFETQGHAAVGIGSDAAHFRTSEYAFIETTRDMYVGQVSAQYDARGPVTKPPEMIVVGGTKRFGAGEQVEFILEYLGSADVTQVVYNEYPQHVMTVSEKYRPRFARRTEEYFDASDTTAWIMANTHDRERVHEELLARERDSDD